MKSLHITVAIAALFALGACSTQNVVSRGTNTQTAFLTEEIAELRAPTYNITAVNVVAPSSLVVSEENSYFPHADIVWRGDLPGNRYEQVATMMESAFTNGVAGMQSGRAVVLNVEITRFHSLTERTRASIGGTHDIDFDITIVDAATGLVIEPTRHIESSLKALGGQKAVLAESHGQTQKVRVSTFLASLIQQELTTPHLVPVS